MLEHTRDYDVAVIGGGVCGTAAAWELAKAGARVALLEKEEIAAGASSTNPGFLVFSYRENPFTMRLALEQDALWDQFQRELGADLEMSRNGGLMPFDAPEQERVLEGLTRQARGFGLKEMELVTARRARELEPGLEGKGISGAAWCAREGHINPFRLNLALADGAMAQGADVFTHTPVTGMEVAGGRVTALETPRGRIRAQLVVAAAGAWTRDVGLLAGADLPVKYEKGEAMVSAPLPRRLNGIVTDGALFALPEGAEMKVGCCMKQAADGNVVIAQATTQPRGHETGNTPDGLIRVARRALTLFPFLKDLEIIRMWSGLVSYVEDKEPLFGPLKSPSNLFIVNSFHSAIGIAPAVGRMVAQYYATGRIPEDAKHYSPQRFLRSAAAQ